MRENIKLAFRNIFKQKTGSLINIYGFSVSLGMCLVLIMFIRQELSFDKFNKNYNSVYRLLNIGKNGIVPIHPVRFSEVLRSNLPELKNGTIVITRGSDSDFFRHDSTDFMIPNVVFTTPSFFEIFSVEFIKGATGSALDSHDKILISESVSKKIFGNENPLGKILSYSNSYEFKVAGVFKDLPVTSHLHAEIFAPAKAQKSLNRFIMESWNCQSARFYYLLPAGTDLLALENKIQAEYEKVIPGVLSFNKYHLQPLSKIHLHSSENLWDNSDKGSINEIRTFMTIAALILFMACFNYINLSNVLSGKKAVYTGIQKTMGAGNPSIFMSFFIETLILDLAGSFVAVMMVIDFLPAFNSIMGSSLSGKNIDSKIILIFTGLVIFTLLFTSLYQSWRLARISPVEVLNKKTRSSVFYAKYSFTGLSQFLSVSQIIISMILIVSLITINKQTSFLMNHKLGFNKSNLILFKNPWNGNNTDNYRLLKDAMNKLPGVKEVATSWNSPGENISNYGIIELVGADKENRVNFGQIPVDAKFLSVVEADFLWGRNFNPSLSSDTNKVVINKFGMDQLALIDPAGRKLRNYFNSGDETYEIIGVVDNIQYQSLREKEKPVIYFLSPEGEGNIIVRLNSLNNMETIDKLKKIWAGIEPDYPFHYEFIENIIQTNYRKEIRSRSLLSVMAYFAIAISMLGIFGLGIFMSQKRTKEIGIRKVNGATIWEIIAMLNKEFVKWVLIAFVIATPGSWFVMHKWLENFVYKTELSWWIFALSGALVLIIALLTVSWKSWQAATRNPVEALRYE